ncbi:hypothetical protein [Kitasatospora sp. A2-31]|uniref:hypothetical protein n=1 Tax=Kitasatospora sp. A2-31 TaxID=2916414 RepID=UPI001EEAFB1E|nr:hypothetical protein [Kitasatospora sp. A2-31]
MGFASLAALGPAAVATPAVAAPAAAAPAAAAPAAAARTTCGPSVQMINRSNTVCVTVDGTSVRVHGASTQLFTGTSGRSFIYDVSASVVGGESLGRETGSVYLGAGTGYVSGPRAVAPCGSTVRASFSLTDFGTPPPASVVEVPVTC